MPAIQQHARATGMAPHEAIRDYAKTIARQPGDRATTDINKEVAHHLNLVANHPKVALQLPGLRTSSI